MAAKNRYRVIVYRAEETVRGETAWKRVWDMRGPASGVRRALELVATKTPLDADGPTPVKAEQNGTVHYPEITINNVPTRNGNAAKLITRVRKLLRQANVSREDISRFSKEARGANGLEPVNDYETVLGVVRTWVSVK